jgi:signal transduction histidine kinase
MKLQFSLVIVGAGILALLVYAAVGQVSQRWLDTYFTSKVFVDREQKKIADQFQDYVRKNHVNSWDKGALDEWTERQNMLYITVYRGDSVIYDSSMSDSDYYKSQPYFDIQFQDGTARVYLDGFFGYQFYLTAMSVSLIVAVMVFLAVCIGFMEKKITYITLLEREVKVLKGGSLDKAISISGADELTSLAQGLNEMRLSLKENMEMKEKLRSANKSLVTGLSHDLRTPLTTLMIYLELLSNGKVPDEEKQRQYVKKCMEKAKQMKVLSDQLFESVLVTEEKEAELEDPQMVQYIMEDVISDMIMFLESQGFYTDCRVIWEPVKIAVSIDYIIRIVNNISSNILKYADIDKPVIIEMKYQKNQVELWFINGISSCRNNGESTKMGVNNIKSMMEKMGGECEVNSYDSSYMMKIKFPVK